MTTVRTEAVAGAFYPGEYQALKSEVDSLLANAPTPSLYAPSSAKPKAIITPHAGYIYSGLTAASVYKTLEPLAEIIKRVVLLGPSHKVAFRGLAYSSADYFQTPLGKIPIDHAAIKTIQSLPQITEMDIAHTNEHSLEVQLPFLQTVLKEFTLVPIVVGDAEPQEVAEVIDKLWGGEETLIVISSDLSHFHNYDQAREMDIHTKHAIEEFRFNDLSYEDACGRIPIQGLLKTAKERQLNITTIDVRNSGDTAGEKNSVVGYGAWVLAYKTKSTH